MAPAGNSGGAGGVPLAALATEAEARKTVSSAAPPPGGRGVVAEVTELGGTTEVRAQLELPDQRDADTHLLTEAAVCLGAGAKRSDEAVAPASPEPEPTPSGIGPVRSPFAADAAAAARLISPPARPAAAGGASKPGSPVAREVRSPCLRAASRSPCTHSLPWELHPPAELTAKTKIMQKEAVQMNSELRGLSEDARLVLKEQSTRLRVSTARAHVRACLEGGPARSAEVLPLMRDSFSAVRALARSHGKPLPALLRQGSPAGTHAP